MVTGRDGKRMTMTIREVIRTGTSVSVCETKEGDKLMLLVGWLVS